MSQILTCDGYRASIYYDADSEMYFGEVLDIQDVLCFNRKKLEDMPEGFRSCLDRYYAGCKQFGDIPERPKYATAKPQNVTPVYATA